MAEGGAGRGGDERPERPERRGDERSGGGAHGSKSATQVRGIPGLGVLPRLFRDPQGTLTAIARAHPGEVVRLSLGPLPLYYLTDPAHVQHVLSDRWRNYSKRSKMWEPLRRLFGEGLVTSEGEVWLRSRKIIQPLFSPGHLQSLAELMGETIGACLDELQGRAAAGPVDMCKETAIITQRVLMAAIFGAGLSRGEGDDLIAALGEALRRLNLRLFLAAAPQRLIPGERALSRAILTIDAAMLRLVRERRQRPAGGRDLLSLLTVACDEAGEGLSERQLRDELVTLFVAGNETTAVTLSWTWWLLDQHPEADARLRRELHEVLGGRPPTHADLPRLPRTKAVIQETLRLYPPSWIIPRQAVDDDVIDGVPIPAGANILLSQYVTQRDPRHWRDADAFDPERWLEPATEGRPRFAYLPFGGGPRRCLGDHFAMMEAQLILARVAQRFRPRLLPGVRVRPQTSTSLQIRGALPMRLDPA